MSKLERVLEMDLSEDEKSQIGLAPIFDTTG
jgi:hypothetical protein